jgi:hypothetical protein
MVCDVRLDKRHNETSLADAFIDLAIQQLFLTSR